MKYVIASSKGPKLENVQEFMQQVREACPSITCMLIVNGPGCVNYGIIAGDEKEVKELTMALMPARYGSAADDDQLVDGLFECRLTE